MSVLRVSVWLAAAAAAAAVAAATTAPLLGLGVWPLPAAAAPRAWDAAAATRPGWRPADAPRVLPAARFVTAAPLTTASPRLARALGRYNALLQEVAAVDGAPAVDVSVEVASTDEELVGASAAYTVTAEGATVTVAADTFVGAAYAMETVVQLVRVHGGLPAVRIDDAPLLAWRGLMLDAGRRFFPAPLVHNILDTMAASKLNVLHWHLADQCRWAVDSALFPAVTSNLTGVFAGSYSAADVADVIAYAGDRGIRVVPEFDTPGHSHGLLALGDEGKVVFCDPADASRSQLYGDPRNVTYATIAALYAEMAGLFTDPIFHIGADETGVVGPCTTESTFALERALLNAVTAANKTPAGWEELLFDAGAATPGSVVYAWNRDSPAAIIADGRLAVDSSDGHWYLTSPASSPFPGGWAPAWADATAGVPAANLSGLLGAEASMWTDTMRYCITAQCGASGGNPPVGAQLFHRELDAEFGRSVGGMIWPRAFVAAGAFWSFNASVDPTSPAFNATINALSDAVAARGGLVCPAGCACDQLSACGEPYLPPPPPPPPGAGALVAPCVQPFPAGAVWVLDASAPVTQLALAANSSLCLTEPPGGGYPLALALCAGGGATKWAHPSASAELVSAATGLCADVREADSVVGTYACGSDGGDKQPNQEWALDAVAGLVMSLLPTGGGCLQVAAA